MKYRDHKGSLSESLETTMEVNSIDEIKNHLNNFYNHFGKSVVEIKFKHIGMDKRIGWDTHYVLLRLNDEKDFTVAGMSNGNLNS